MAEMITRCPKCETAFRITPGHLRSARGSVRCGSCLQVFNARDNLTESSLKALAATNTEARVQEQAPEKPASTPSAEPGDTEDILISDDMELTDDEAESETDDVFPPPSPAMQTSLFERAAHDGSSDQAEDEATEDESWALKLLDDDDPTPVDNLRGRSPVATAPADDFISSNEADQAPEEDRDLREELLESHHAVARPLYDEATTALDREDNDASDFEPQPMAASRRETTGSAYLDAIEPEPVEFAVRKERTFWRSRLLWAGLSLVALLALLGQIAWLQYPALNRIEPYRGFYAIACKYLGCRLPAQVDLQAIRTSNLVVRSHPRRQNALMVDVVLQNTAPFIQPFPALELTFSNLQDDVVARRRFSPGDYLGGELAGQNMMPIKQPVHIAMEIVDPGSDAVNYRVEVVDDGG